jgi:lipopolysaccharide transport system ATP-binding protein
MRFLHRFRQQGSLLFVSHDSEAVVRLCDRVLWLDHGEVRDYGDAREMCRRYRVAQSEVMAQESSGFRVGGRLKPLAPPPRIPGEAIFGFDPERPGDVAGGATLLNAGFYDLDGAAMGAAAGGEDVELRIAARAEGPLARPVFAFVLRDRLGQILFGDESHSRYGETPPAILAGEDFVARFKFRLPHLASGGYAVEIFLFEDHALLAHVQEAVILHVQSRHISTGLANLAMRQVSLALTPEPSS